MRLLMDFLNKSFIKVFLLNNSFIFVVFFSLKEDQQTCSTPVVPTRLWWYQVKWCLVLLCWNLNNLRNYNIKLIHNCCLSLINAHVMAVTSRQTKCSKTFSWCPRLLQRRENFFNGSVVLNTNINQNLICDGSLLNLFLSWSSKCLNSPCDAQRGLWSLPGFCRSPPLMIAGGRVFIIPCVQQIQR